MERVELLVSGILVLAVTGGALWNAHRVHSSGLHPIIVETESLPEARRPAIGGGNGPRPTPGGSPAARLQPLTGRKRDLNRATAEELAEVSGIGPVLSREIVSHREQHGPFRTIQGLLAVPGIGPSRTEAVGELFEVITPEGSAAPGQGAARAAPAAGPGREPTPDFRNAILPSPPRPRKININTATREELTTLPGIGAVLAERIIEERRARGRFVSPPDIQRVEGIGPRKFDAIRDMIETGP